MKFLKVFQSLFLLSIATLIGCGSSGEDLKTVNGTVKYQGKPLANAMVTFMPIEDTPGIGGRAKTNEAGEFEVVYAHGGDGLPPGKYKVTVSQRLMPDGSAAPDDVDPFESPAKESLPPKYSDETATTITKTISPEGGSVDIDLE